MFLQQPSSTSEYCTSRIQGGERGNASNLISPQATQTSIIRVKRPIKLLRVTAIFALDLWIVVKVANYMTYMGNNIFQPQKNTSEIPSPSRKQDDEEDKNETLVVLLGNARGGESTWESLYRNLLDVNNADLALILGKSDNRTSSLYQRAKYVWEFQEHTNWSYAIDIAYADEIKEDTEYTWRSIARNSTLGAFGGTEEDRRGSGAVSSLARWFLRERIVDLGIHQRYNRFVVTRTDQYYVCALDLSMANRTQIWVPEGEDYGGICDRWFMCGSDKILQLLDVLRPAVMYPKRYLHFRGNIESFIKLRWRQEGLWQYVRRFRRCMFSAAIPGDPTRCGKASSETLEGGVKYKYRREFLTSAATCSLLNSERFNRPGFCSHCAFTPTEMGSVTCVERALFLQKRFNLTDDEAIDAVVGLQPMNCNRTKGAKEELVDTPQAMKSNLS